MCSDPTGTAQRGGAAARCAAARGGRDARRGIGDGGGGGGGGSGGGSGGGGGRRPVGGVAATGPVGVDALRLPAMGAPRETPRACGHYIWVERACSALVWFVLLYKGAVDAGADPTPPRPTNYAW